MKILDALLELIFPTPRICPFCNKVQEGLYVCSVCWQELEELKLHLGQCARCGTFGCKVSQCSNCFYWPQYYQSNYALFPYTQKWRKTIHKLKFEKQGWLVPPLVELMVTYLDFDDIDYVIPVPLHQNRLRERGFNQAGLIANHLAAKKGWIYKDDFLQRIVATPHQSGLSGRKRIENMKKVFQVSHAHDALKGKNILLVDDLVTSGATLVECAKTLGKSGVKKVASITLGAGIN